MKHILVLLLYFSLCTNCLAQKTDDCDLYASSISKIKTFKYHKLDIKFNLEISESLKKSILNSELFDNQEKVALEKILSDYKIKKTMYPCKRIRDLVMNIKGRELNNDVDKGIVINYLEPVWIDSGNAYLVMEQISTSSKTGVTVGATIMEIYAKMGSDWVAEDKLILEQY